MGRRKRYTRRRRRRRRRIRGTGKPYVYRNRVCLGKKPQTGGGAV